MKILSLSFSCLLLGIICSTALASITINNCLFYAEAGSGTGGPGVSDSHYFFGRTIPTLTTLNAVDGDAHNNTTIDWSVNGGQTILKFDMDHKRAATVYSWAETEAFPLKFTANSDAPYKLSGYYNVTDIGATSGQVFLNVSFYDETDNVWPFGNQQISINTLNEQFVLGGTSGDYHNNLSGSLTGNLIAGHVYQLSFNPNIHTSRANDLGGTALGNLTLTIGNLPGDFNNDLVVNAADYVVWRKNNGPSTDYDLWRANFGNPPGSGSSIESASVPEPSTLLLLGICAISLLGYRKSK